MSSLDKSSYRKRRFRFRLTFAVVTVFVAAIITWLIMGEGSPFHDYLIWDGRLRNLWGMTTLLPFIFGAILSGNPHQSGMVGFVLGFIVQWFILGFLLSVLVSWPFIKRKS